MMQLSEKWRNEKYQVSVSYISDGTREIRPPMPASMEMPSYPIGLASLDVASYVILSFLVAKDGSIHDLRIEDAPILEFADAAKDAVGKWHCIPASDRHDHTKIYEMRMKCRFDFTTIDGPIQYK